MFFEIYLCNGVLLFGCFVFVWFCTRTFIRVFFSSAAFLVFLLIVCFLQLEAVFSELKYNIYAAKGW